MSVVPKLNDMNERDPNRKGSNEDNEAKDIRDKSPSLLWYLFRRKTVVVGMALFLIMVACSTIAPVLSNYTPSEIIVESRLTGPNLDHYLGTDNLGRDVFSRIMYGGRASLMVGISVVMFAVGGGTLVGLICGYYRRIDFLLMRVVDGLMSFPGLILAITMMGVLGSSVMTVVIALSIVYGPRVARVVRSSALVVREYPLIEAEKALGAKDGYILFKHVLPNCLSPIIVQATFIFSYAILGEAALSFLGVGVPPTTPSWGNILSDSRVYIVQGWWMAIFPGLAIMITVFGLNLFGDGLRDIVDPKSRKL